MNHNLKKSKGFTIIEVLFAVVILSISLSYIVIFVSNMIMSIKKNKDYSLVRTHSPLIFSNCNPTLHKNSLENNKDKKNFSTYDEVSELNKKHLDGFDSLSIASGEMQNGYFLKKYYSNTFFKVNKKDETNNEKNNI